jgi:putative AdoMet-dependent methyltransferase
VVRSRHVDRFNHDPEAAGYDADVENEDDPIRAGYADTLAWVADQAGPGPAGAVVDLGAGTGNLSARLASPARLVCVDASARMLAQAEVKLPPSTEYVVADLLEYVTERDEREFHVAVSTYAIHHLTEPEKAALFRGLATRLRRGGRFVAGDLMLANRDEVTALRGVVSPAVLDELLDEEFPWLIDAAHESLGAAGFHAIRWQRLSPLSWAVSARLG